MPSTFPKAGMLTEHALRQGSVSLHLASAIASEEATIPGPDMHPGELTVIRSTRLKGTPIAPFPEEAFPRIETYNILPHLLSSNSMTRFVASQ